MADSEIIVDMYKYCVNINANLLKQRDIEILPNTATTTREDTGVVMQKTLPARVSDQLGSTSAMQEVFLFGPKYTDSPRTSEKPSNKYIYLPFRSRHAEHVITNYVTGERKKRHVRTNTNFETF